MNEHAQAFGLTPIARDTRPDMHIRELIQLLDSILDPSSYRDYAPNGLQVQGNRDVKRLVTGVTASLDLIEAAAAQGADAILVHHGWFWKGEEARITGIRYQRISRLIESGMHLIGSTTCRLTIIQKSATTHCSEKPWAFRATCASAITAGRHHATAR